MNLKRLQPVGRFIITRPIGLVAPAGGAASPFAWRARSPNDRPHHVRFAWNPLTGKAVVGVNCHHVTMIPQSRRYPFEVWVRGFYFPKDRLFAIRRYREISEVTGAVVNNRVMEALCGLLRQEVAGAGIELDIDNEWLAAKIGIPCA